MGIYVPSSGSLESFFMFLQILLYEVFIVLVCHVKFLVKGSFVNLYFIQIITQVSLWRKFFVVFAFFVNYARQCLKFFIENNFSYRLQLEIIKNRFQHVFDHTEPLGIKTFSSNAFYDCANTHVMF